jgi:hypothetical protein
MNILVNVFGNSPIPQTRTPCIVTTGNTSYFMIHVHRTMQPPVAEDELRDALAASNFPAGNVDRLVIMYTRGLDLLRRYDELGQ